jgi:hypothetical protein
MSHYTTKTYFYFYFVTDVPLRKGFRTKVPGLRVLLPDVCFVPVLRMMMSCLRGNRRRSIWVSCRDRYEPNMKFVQLVSVQTSNIKYNWNSLSTFVDNTSDSKTNRDYYPLNLPFVYSINWLNTSIILVLMNGVFLQIKRNKCQSQWPCGLRHEMFSTTRENWDLGFESHSRHGYMSFFCVSADLHKQRPCDGLISHLRTPTNFLYNSQFRLILDWNRQKI